MLNTRENLRETVISALRQRQSMLLKCVHETAVQAYDGKALTAYYEIVAVSSLLDRLSSPDSPDPFMEFHRRQSNGDTIYKISDNDIEMIASDLDTFICKAVQAMCDRLEYCAASVLDADSIGFDLYNAIDRMMYAKKQKRDLDGPAT